MSDSLTTTDRAAVIRAALKAKGWNTRKVSVRADYYSMGSSIYVTIKDASVPLKAVEAIATEHESIDRDQFGDILSGGNRYVWVKYSREACEVLESMYGPALQEAFQELTQASPNSLIPIGQTGFMLGRDNNGYGVSLWSQIGHIQSANEPRHLASTLAVHLQAA